MCLNVFLNSACYGCVEVGLTNDFIFRLLFLHLPDAERSWSGDCRNTDDGGGTGASVCFLWLDSTGVQVAVPSASGSNAKASQATLTRVQHNLTCV